MYSVLASRFFSPIFSKIVLLFTVRKTSDHFPKCEGSASMMGLGPLTGVRGRTATRDVIVGSRHPTGSLHTGAGPGPWCHGDAHWRWQGSRDTSQTVRWLRSTSQGKGRHRAVDDRSTKRNARVTWLLRERVSASSWSPNLCDNLCDTCGKLSHKQCFGFNWDMRTLQVGDALWGGTDPCCRRRRHTVPQCSFKNQRGKFWYFCHDKKHTQASVT